MNAERPTPNNDSASPVATWLARNVSATTAKMIDRIAAASAPAATPSHGDCVCAATMKDAIAPTSIMPSTPRLSTPDFSTTSSPSAANTSGVPAARLRRTSCVIVSMSTDHSRLHDANAIVDEHVGCEQEEQQRSLEESRHRRWHRKIDLRGFATEIQQRHQHVGEHDPERMQPSHERDDDRGGAISRRHRGQ